MKIYIALVFACIVLTAGNSCKKVDNPVNQNLDSNNQKAVDFMSTKSGSYWKYGSREGTPPYTRFARDKDTVKDGLKYSYYERQDDSTGTIFPEYFGKNNEYHITLVDLDGNRETYLPYAFWKDSAKQGDTWNNTGVVYHPLVGNVNIVMESSQSEDGLTMTFGGKTYNNVIHVHSDAKATAINAKIGTFDIWFIKGLGIIREEAHIDVLGAYTQTHIDSLLSYHIEP